MSTDPSVASYYEEFTPRFIDDYVRGNSRADRQVEFFVSAIARSARRVLVVGCGSGEVTRALARRLPAVRFLGVDISSASIHVARRLFAHRRVEYRVADIVQREIEPSWDAILLPDVYEHIPTSSRAIVNEALGNLLAPRGQILLTVPSPQHQAHLRENGGLQIVDEVVTVPDLLALCDSISGSLTYLNSIAVWRPHDYWHVVLERIPASLAEISQDDETPLRKSGRSTFVGNVLKSRLRPPARSLRLLLRHPGDGKAWLAYRKRGRAIPKES